MEIPLMSKNIISMVLFWFQCLNFLCLWIRKSFPLHGLLLHFWIILEEPSLVTGDCSVQEIFIIFSFLQNSKTVLLSYQLVIITQVLLDHFGAHFFLLFRFVVKIYLAISLSIFISSAIILVPKQWSFLKRILIFTAFSSALIVTRQPGCSSSSMSSLPAENHSNTLAHNRVFLPYSSYKKLFWWQFSSVSQEIWCVDSVLKMLLSMITPS